AAAPLAPAPPAAPVPIPAVPDAGSRPIPLGTLTMPGRSTPAAAVTPTTGIPTSPLLAKLEKRRAEIAALGDTLIRLGQDRDLARRQQATATTKVTDAQAVQTAAQRDASAAAANALRTAAALPPGALGSGLQDLDELAQIQLGDTATENAAARQLALAQAALAAAQAEQASAATRATDLSARYDKLNRSIGIKQAALQKLEHDHADEISAAEAAESAADRRLGAEYLAGAQQGRGADRRAIAALQYALDQRGDPYLWSAEGPDEFDCSGLMYAAYHAAAAGNFPLARVSRDQYWQTRNKVVDRYSLLPGDLLFFSSTNSWTGIHHVAMYAGNGMMVEAPRTGLDVRLTPVRWTRLFQATRVYGSVDGPVQGPDLSAPPPSNGNGGTTAPTTRPTTRPPTSPSSTPPTSPSSTPPTSSSAPSSSPSPSASGSSTTTPSTTGTPGTPSSSSSSGGSSPTGSSGSSSGGSSSTSSSSSGSAPSSGSTSSGSSSSSSSSSSSASSSSSSSASSSSSSSAAESRSASATASASPSSD
ncbi:MAG TPA: NlpC/P60 family protein, partial [Actinoplanes sp.]